MDISPKQDTSNERGDRVRWPSDPLAAANRDPLANSDPQRFDITRRDRRLFTLGTGAHVCPGEALAIAVAEAGVAQLIASGMAIDRLVDSVTYRPSVNVRIPLFGTACV